MDILVEGMLEHPPMHMYIHIHNVYSESTNYVTTTRTSYVCSGFYMCAGPLSNLRKNEMHLGKQPKLINHGNPVS